jgi:glycosyltransferase involved in cell wall biosynthesis
MISIVIPFFNQLSELSGVLYLLKQQTITDVEWIFIDNGSSDPIEKYIYRYFKPKKVVFIRNEQNEGIVKAWNQGIEASSGEIIAFLHNDLYIYDLGWDKKVYSLFNKIDKLGIVGFHGSPGTKENAGRFDAYSNLVEADIHGQRLTEEYLPVVILDGIALICSKEMLNKTGGVDMNYKFFHISDADLSLESLRVGYKNIVTNVYCHHARGATSNSPAYYDYVNKLTNQRDGNMYFMEQNRNYFNEKWGPNGYDVLPFYIEKDWSFLGPEHNLIFNGQKVISEFGLLKGDKIKHLL